MPNWMNNVMTVTGQAEELDRFVKDAETDESKLSFQKLYPCPEDLINQEADSIHDIGYEVFFEHSKRWELIAGYPWVMEKNLNVAMGRDEFRKGFKEKFKDQGYYKAGVESDRMVKKYGYRNWYDWRNDNWGTKWDTRNPNRHIIDPCCVQYEYDTAWSPPTYLFETVSKQYPGLTFHFDCTDEDGTKFEFDIQNGKMTG